MSPPVPHLFGLFRNFHYTRNSHLPPFTQTSLFAPLSWQSVRRRQPGTPKASKLYQRGRSQPVLLVNEHVLQQMMLKIRPSDHVVRFPTLLYSFALLTVWAPYQAAKPPKPANSNQSKRRLVPSPITDDEAPDSEELRVLTQPRRKGKEISRQDDDHGPSGSSGEESELESSEEEDDDLADIHPSRLKSTLDSEVGVY